MGYYGDKCQQKCDCADGGTCHHVTGQCLCKLGWTGARCNEGNYRPFGASHSRGKKSAVLESKSSHWDKTNKRRL